MRLHVYGTLRTSTRTERSCMNSAHADSSSRKKRPDRYRPFPSITTLPGEMIPRHFAEEGIPQIDPKQLTSVDLVRKCVDSGEEPYWCEFVARFQPVIARVVAKAAGRYSRPSRALVDDLVQSTYLKLCAGHYRLLKNLNEKREDSIYGLLKVVAS